MAEENKEEEETLTDELAFEDDSADDDVIIYDADAEEALEAARLNTVLEVSSEPQGDAPHGVRGMADRHNRRNG